MKAFFSSFKTTLFSLFFLLIASAGWGQTTGSITITRTAFASGALAYGADDLWTVTSTTGQAVEGNFDIFSNVGQTTMQTRINAPIGSYPYNTIALPGAITGITLTGGGTGTARAWTPYLSTTALTKSNYESGISQGAKTATSNSASTTWVADAASGFKYFYLNMTDGVAYLNSIIITYKIDPAITTTAASVIATKGATLNGTINANNLSVVPSFQYGTTVVYDKVAIVTPSPITGTTSKNITAAINSLSVNTLYHYRAVGTVGTTATNGADQTFYTLAATPQAAAVDNEKFTSLDVTLDGVTQNGNPANTAYAIQESTTNQYVQANGTLGATVVWQTAANWGTKTVTGLTPSTVYGFKVKARNGDNVETPFGVNAGGDTLNALGTPIATAATPIGVTSFSANWNAVPNAASYRLDVSTSPTFGAASTSLAEWTFPAKSAVANIASTNNTTKTLTTNTGNITGTIDFPVRNSSFYALTSKWTNGSGGKFWEININTEGFTNLHMSFDQRSSATGPRDFKIQYKVGAGSWIDAGLNVKIPALANDQWGAPYSLSLPTACDNQSSVSIRWIMTSNTSTNGATVVDAGTSGIDNIRIVSISDGLFVQPYENLNVDNFTSHEVSGLNPATLYYYRVRAVSNAVASPNSNVIEVTTLPITTTTYNGSVLNDWDYGIPNVNLNAVINGAYTTAGNLVSKSLTINTDQTLTIAENTSFTTGDFTNNGTLVVESDGNFVQTEGSTNTGSGSATVKRNATMKRLDYTYWGSPVSGQMLKPFSPGTLDNRFLEYNSLTDKFSAVDSPSNTEFTAGKGYAIRASNYYPVWDSENGPIASDYKLFEGNFEGLPHNGDQSFQLNTEGQGFNLVGNPYPSNIDFYALVTNNNNNNIDGKAYFWTNINRTVYGQLGPAYNGENYATLTAVSGGVPATNGTLTTETPTQYIKVGQGFIVKANTASSLTFTNAMRNDGTGASKFINRGISESPSVVDRFWLTLTTPAQNFNTILIAYPQGATNDFESNADAKQFGESSDSFYTQLDDMKLNIQGRQFPLVRTDVVSLGMKGFETGNYKIALASKEGIFANGQNIYLKDNQTNTVTNLSAENYTFAANEGLTEGRFEIIYENEIVLGTGSSKKEELIVYRDGTDFIVKSASKKISDVEVYDTSGRLILKLNPNHTEIRIDGSAMINGVYVLKVNRNGDVHTKKIAK